MKKLVKTAKQQFEERLEHFNLMGDWYKQSCQGRIGKDLGDEGVVIFVHESNEDGFSEYHYPSFSELRDDANFIQECLRKFSCCSDEFILSMARWFTYDSTENPFDAVDVYSPSDTFKLNSNVDFSDLYEEVPDVRIITAKEQWENDSIESTIQESEGDTPFKIVISDTSLKFYYYEYGYYCNVYPPLEYLRKNDLFIKDITDRLLEFTNYEGVGRLQDWIRVGGDFPLSFGWIFYSEFPCTDVIIYEDKELLQEQTIAKKNFSTEITDLKERMIKHIEELYEQGMTLNSDSFLKDNYSITWDDGSYYACANLVSCKLSKSDEGVLCFSETQTNDKDVTYDSPLQMLTINTLCAIIDAMSN